MSSCSWLLVLGGEIRNPTRAIPIPRHPTQNPTSHPQTDPNQADEPHKDSVPPLARSSQQALRSTRDERRAALESEEKGN